MVVIVRPSPRADAVLAANVIEYVLNVVESTCDSAWPTCFAVVRPIFLYFSVLYFKSDDQNPTVNPPFSLLSIYFISVVDVDNLLCDVASFSCVAAVTRPVFSTLIELGRERV